MSVKRFLPSLGVPLTVKKRWKKEECQELGNARMA